jgi:cyclic-di-GMP phosphodiesterase TipF (flagellum assembly factor)
LPSDREPSADDWRLVEAFASSSIGPASDEPAGLERRAESAVPADLAPAPELWNFRPGDRHGPATPQGPGADVRPDRSAEIGQGAALSGESAAIDQILKRLAAQIQSGKEIPVQRDPAGEASTVSAATEAEQAMALESAVDALRSTVDVMRRDDQGAAAKPASKPGAMPEPAGRTGGGQPGEASATPAEVRLAAVAEALARERVDVFLEPILGLADERARHFEVTVRLKTPAGEAIHHAEVEQAGRGAGLLPLLDALRVRHSAGLALRLERRGREGSVFSDMTSESLENRRFLSSVAQSHGHGELIANRLVLAFAQREVRGFTRAQWSALAGLRDLGFRFALQGVGDLDMDFGVLKATGFEFVKLDAHVFLQGLPLGECIVPASDLCRHMAGSGLALVVGGIDNELDRARIFGFGVLFGQGALFGAPRPISVGGGAAAGVAA